MEKEKIREIRQAVKNRLNRNMRCYLDLCTRCGLCYDTCHTYQGIPEQKYSPVDRAELVRRVYRKNFCLSGKLIPAWGDALEINDVTMDKLREAAFSCTGCRRCMVHCPFAIDTPFILSSAKEMLIANCTAPEELVILADSSVEKGESIDEFREGYREVIRDLEKNVAEKLGRSESDGLIPMDKKGARVLYVGLAGAHSIVNPAVIFNAAGENWTLSYFEAVNFGAFLGDQQKMRKIAMRIINEAQNLGVEELVIVECGTAFRIPRYMMGKLPFKVTSIVEVIHRYLEQGKIRLKENSVNEALTYHDPCQLGRNGGVYEEPREILSKLCTDYREMTPNRKYNWCCGGGGGLGALDNEDFRIKSGKPKMEQIEQTGAKIVVSACENCVSQLETIKAGYGLDIEVKFLSELVVENLVL